jgi:hypothetical protein
MRSDPVGGGHRCEKHGRVECTRRSKRSQLRCHQPAIRGTDVCRAHAGRRTETVKAEGRVRLETANVLSALPGPGAPMADPGEVILRLLTLAVDRVELAGRLLAAEFEAAAAAGRAEADPAGEPRSQPAGTSGTPRVGPPGTEALIGHRHVLDKAGNRVPVGEATRGLAAYEAEWADRAGRLARDAHIAGVIDRREAREEALGKFMAAVLRASLADLGVQVGEDQVQAVVAARVRAIGGAK